MPDASRLLAFPFFRFSPPLPTSPFPDKINHRNSYMYTILSKGVL